MTNGAREKAISHLVEMTISREGREKLGRIVNTLKAQRGSAGRQAAKQMVQQEFGISPEDVLEIADEFCDRLYAGIDDDSVWTSEERDDWIEVCQIVTELTSSDVD